MQKLRDKVQTPVSQRANTYQGSQTTKVVSNLANALQEMHKQHKSMP